MKEAKPYHFAESSRADSWAAIRFVGVGGIGMSALARYFASKGVRVSGYDRSPSPLIEQLESEGIGVDFEPNVAALQKVDAVVYTPAVPADHPELRAANELGLPVLKRAQVLGQISRNRFTIAVAGSHGKTTVSSMIAQLLSHSGYGCTAFLGGIAVNFNSNFVGGRDDVLVVEADEFDRSFLQLEPDIAVVTAIDSDHLDVYGDEAAVESAFIEFVHQIKDGGKLVAKWGLAVHDHFKGRSLSYSLSEESADRCAAELEVATSGSSFTLGRRRYRLNWPGVHNIENAIAAISVAETLGIPDPAIEAALAEFKGISRRFQIRYLDSDRLFIDDYAHHPEEIRALLDSVRRMTDRKITVVFQPHLYSRTRDLASEFGAALSLADHLILLPVYPAREEPIEGVTSKLIADAVSAEVELLSKAELLPRIQELQPAVLLTAGAGDIDRLVDPLLEQFENNSSSA